MNTRVMTNDIRAIPIARAEARSTTWHGVLVAGLMFVGILISLLFISQSLRLDEAQSLWQTNGTLERTLNLVGQDVHMPLYHIILNGWQQLFGNSVENARLLSLVFFILTIPAVYYLGRTIYSSATGLFAATLITVSPFLNWYGSEIRMYSLLTFLAVLNLLAYVKIFQRSRGGYWFLYLGTALLGIYTHYFFGLLLLTQAIFYFLYIDQFPARSFIKFATIGILVAMSIVPWIWFAQSVDTGGDSTPLIPAPTSINIFNAFSQFMFGFHDDTINTILVSLWPLSVLLVFMAIGKGKRVQPETILFVLSVAIPFAAAYAISVLYRPVFLSRYLIITLPALYLVISWMFSTYRKPLAWAFKLGLVGVMAFTLSVEAMSATNPLKEDYKAVSSYLQEHALASDMIYISAPFTVYPMEYYYKGRSEMATIPAWDRQASGAIPPFSDPDMRAQVAADEQDHTRAWVVTSYDQGYEDEVIGFFDANFKRLYEREFSPGLVMRLYQL